MGIAPVLFVNGRKLATAGVGSTGVVAANVTWVGHVEGATPSKRATRRGRVGVAVGGLDTSTDEHLEWSQRRLAVGDEVRIKIIETESVDRPRIRQRRNHAEELREQKRYIRDMAKTFGWTVRTRGDAT